MSDMSVMRDSSMNLCKILKKLGGGGVSFFHMLLSAQVETIKHTLISSYPSKY